MKKTLTLLTLLVTVTAHSQLQKLYDREASYQHFNGSVLVQKKDSVIFSASYGTRDGFDLISSETQFDIGSVTKQFTAAAILHLVKEGKFLLSDPINMHLGKHAEESWKKVTIHHLLTHTSGIPSLYQTEQGLELFFPESKPISLDDLIAKFKDGKLLFSPGEEFNYSNSGYILLAAIIEQTSGMTYERFMEKELFEAYGLSKTSFRPNSEAAKPFYGYRSDLWEEAPIHHISWFKGAGGLYSTPGDLSKWIQLINSEEFLTSNLRDKLLKSHTSVGYGYGWQFDGDYIQHDGGNDGFISFVSFDPETQTNIVVLTNRSFQDIKMFGKSANYVRSLVAKTWSVIEGEEIEVLPEIVEDELTKEDYTLKEATLSISPNDSVLTVTLSESYPSRILYNTPLVGSNELEKKMIDIADYLDRGKYWSLAKYCDGEMKFVMYAGLMGIGMRMMKKQTGGADEFIPYFVDEKHGLVRMKGPEGILDLIVYFDDQGRIKGVFEHGFYEQDKQVSMLAYPIGQNLFYLDGLPYGENSATLKVTSDSLTVYQVNRSVTAKRK